MLGLSEKRNRSTIKLRTVRRISMITYEEAINKAHKYLSDADAPVGFFASNRGNTSKPETTLPAWQEMCLSSSIKIAVKSLI